MPNRSSKRNLPRDVNQLGRAKRCQAAGDVIGLFGREMGPPISHRSFSQWQSSNRAVRLGRVRGPEEQACNTPQAVRGLCLEEVDPGCQVDPDHVIDLAIEHESIR